MRMLLTALGVLMVLMGLLWVGQGAGLIRWPADSFMIGVSDWTWRGALFALGGLLLIWAGRRRPGGG
jgi:membrane protein implicated in regulation of membrane protease activity